jgi:hypothetical protein
METKTFSVAGVTFQWVNNMLGAIRFHVMCDRFASEAHADRGSRETFCYVMAYADDVDGLPIVDDKSTDNEFEDSYRAFAKLVKIEQWKETAAALDALKGTTANAEEKKDSALTPEEEADPN